MIAAFRAPHGAASREATHAPAGISIDARATGSASARSGPSVEPAVVEGARSRSRSGVAAGTIGAPFSAVNASTATSSRATPSGAGAGSCRSVVGVERLRRLAGIDRIAWPPSGGSRAAGTARRAPARAARARSARRPARARRACRSARFASPRNRSGRRASRGRARARDGPRPGRRAKGSRE